jgi:chondroitin 4-sulfotransferase 11
MQISHRHKFINVANPKTASTSTLRTLKKYADVFGTKGIKSPYYYHAETSVMQKEFVDIWDSYFKFCFVRNPWDRIVSHYFFSRYGSEKNHNTFDFAKTTFEDFVENHVMNEKDCLICKKQSVWYSGVDYIARYENYEDEITNIFNLLKIEDTPVIHNINKTQHNHYEKYYNDRTIMMVYEKYKDEIDYLGYEYYEKL